MMKKSHLHHYLDALLSNEDVARAKPDPEIYQKAIAQLGFRPEECLVVEDNDNGSKAAKASGAHVMTVRDVDDVNIDTIVAHIRQIDKQGSAA
jgi:HAD superfamily hydrolase (TIGR01509 family)